MIKTFKLKRTIQCAKCPWKKEANPYEIPNGYCVKKHLALEKTIATDVTTNLTNNQFPVMACHNSDNDEYCVGWLHHQLGRGNNMVLRLKMMFCENIEELKTIGEQHKTFEDTLPKDLPPTKSK